MSISLSKGGKLNLAKKEPTLQKIMIGLGWELKQSNALDLDASVFMIAANGKIPLDEFFIFYNNLRSPDGAVQHTGDNRTGIGEDDDEMILANLAQIDSRITELVFVVTIHEATVRQHHFGLLNEAYIRLVDVAGNREIARYKLDENTSQFTEMEFGRLIREADGWHFVATGVGSAKGLQGYVDVFV